MCGCLCCWAFIALSVKVLESGGSSTCFESPQRLVGAGNATLERALALSCTGTRAFVGVPSERRVLDYALNASQLYELQAAIDGEEALFGAALAFDEANSALLVGAPGASLGAGAIVLYVDGNASDSLESLEGAGARFGLAVALVARVAAVGAPLAPDGGRVDLFELNVSGRLVARRVIEAPDGAEEFGASVALSCDASRLFVGAPASSRVFEYNVSSLALLRTLDSPLNHTLDHFGAALALAKRGARYVSVGAPGARAVLSYTRGADDALVLYDETFNDALDDFGRALALECASPPRQLLVGSDGDGAALYRLDSSSGLFLADSLSPRPSGFAVALARAGNINVVSNVTSSLAVANCTTRLNVDCPAC